MSGARAENNGYRGPMPVTTLKCGNFSMSFQSLSVGSAVSMTIGDTAKAARVLIDSINQYVLFTVVSTDLRNTIELSAHGVEAG